MSGGFGEGRGNDGRGDVSCNGCSQFSIFDSFACVLFLVMLL